MKNPLEFYTLEKTDLEKKAKKLKNKSANLSVFRFAVFLITCFLIYLTFGNYPSVFIIAFLGFLLFGFSI